MTGPGPPLDAVVVGAGITGLTAAFHLQRCGRSVVVLEARDRVGGAIRSHAQDGFRCELGPNTVLAGNEELPALIRHAGLAERQVEASPQAHKRYLFKAGGLLPLPASPPAFLASKVFSWRAKLRLLREPWIRRGPADRDETIADFVRRRLGEELLRNAVGPFVSGVYAGDPERLAARWAVPRITALEAEHGSLIRAQLARRRSRGSSGPGGGAGGPGGAMISFPEGLEELPRRLAASLDDVRRSTPAQAVARDGDAFRVATPGGPVMARRLVVATPATATAELLQACTDGAAASLAEVPYAPVAVVSLGVPRDAVAHPLDGFGFLAPRAEGLRLLGCLFVSSIFPGRAPAGHALLTAFVGGRTQPELAGLEEAALVELVREELGLALGLTGEPVLAVVHRWPRAIPQYEVGHGRHVARVTQIEDAQPGLFLTGNYVGGISVPDRVRAGAAVAARIDASL